MLSIVNSYGLSGINGYIIKCEVDISNGLPGYEEIPVPVEMDTELYNTYQDFERKG